MRPFTALLLLASALRSASGLRGGVRAWSRGRDLSRARKAPSRTKKPRIEGVAQRRAGGLGPGPPRAAAGSAAEEVTAKWRRKKARTQGPKPKWVAIVKERPAAEIRPLTGYAPLRMGITRATVAGRDFRYHVPKAHQSSLTKPLFFVFHGQGLNGECSLANFGLLKMSEDYGYIAVAGESHGPKWNVGNTPEVDTDDVQFFRDMVAYLQRRTLVEGILVSGFSRGGYMTYRLACEASDLVTVGAVVSGGLAADCSRQENPVPLLHFHGTADRNVAFSCASSAVWRYKSSTTMACQGEAKEVYSMGNMTCQAYTQCAGGASVRLCTIKTARHSWPGAQKYCAATDSTACCGCSQPDASADVAKMVWWYYDKYLRKASMATVRQTARQKLHDAAPAASPPKEDGPVADMVPCSVYGCHFCPDPEDIPVDKCAADPYGGCDGSGCKLQRYVKRAKLPDWMLPTAENPMQMEKFEDAARAEAPGRGSPSSAPRSEVTGERASELPSEVSGKSGDKVRSKPKRAKKAAKRQLPAGATHDSVVPPVAPPGPPALAPAASAQLGSLTIGEQLPSTATGNREP